MGKAPNQNKKTELSRNKELDPLIREHNAKIAPIVETYDAKLTPLRSQSTDLEKEIDALLKANVDGEGDPVPVHIATEMAGAELTKTEGARVVSVLKFFDSVKTRTAAFWECLKVEVGKADKLLGKDKVDQISEKSTSFKVKISLKK